MTPFHVVYDHDPPALHSFVLGETKIAELEQQLLQRDAMLKLMRSNLL